MRRFGNRWVLLCALSLTCALWLAWAFPRLHPAARLKLAFDREGYVAMAREFAARHMMDVSGWGAYAEAETLTKNQDLRLTMPDNDMAKHFPDAAVHTYFIPSGNGTNASLTFRPDGHPLDWKLPLPREMKKADMDMPDPVMHELAGADSAHYNGVTVAGNADAAENEYKWQMAEHEAGSAHIAIDEAVRNGVVWKADTIYTLPEAVAKRFDAFPAVRFAGGITWYVLLIVAAVVAVLREGSGRTAGAMKERSPIVLGCAVGVGAALTFILNWGSVAAESPSTSSAAYEVLVILLGGTLFGLPYYLMCAGTALCARLHPSLVRGFRLLGSRDFLSRSVGTELLAGWLASAVTVALPLAIGAAMGRPTFGGYSDDFLLSRFPFAVGLLGAFDWANLALAGLFGVMVPLALRLLGPKWVLPATAMLAITTFAMQSAPFREAAAATLVWAALQGCFSLWLYLRFGMLGAISSHCLARVLTNAGAALVQPAAGLKSSGLEVLAVFCAFGLAAMLVAWKAPESATELYGEGGLRGQARSRREQLKVEFHVARSAQQRMLPSSPPVLEGYSLAAHCEPAREVGGDLYDFIRLRDGRWGIGVADVSGKGVPAALYMTLTKGLLCAAAQDSGDPGHILGSVNRHLRTVAKKKMFVTMALGVLDPESRTLQYARAGHNPVVWRRAGAGETLLLSGPGIGLGIASPALFARTLKTEMLELAPGDALVFYSDGLTEAMNEVLEQFGEERLMAAVESTDGMHAEATRDSILREVKRFLGGGNSQDDLTIAVLRVD